MIDSIEIVAKHQIHPRPEWMFSIPQIGIAPFFSDVTDRFASSRQSQADEDELAERLWLRLGAGSQWGDEAPNRLFGAWLKSNGDAV